MKKDAYQTLLVANQKLTEQLTAQTMMVEKLHAQIEKLLRVLYGKKSEKKPSEPPAPDVPDEGSSDDNNASGNPKQKPKRKPLPAHLPRVEVTHDIAPDKKCCAECQLPLRRIGCDITEQLEFVPAQLIVKAHTRWKYAYQCDHGNIIQASLPAQPIDKGMPGSGLLAEVLVNKYQDALPLYRQEQRWARLGMELSRKTLCDWVSASARILSPLVDRMKQELLATQHLFTDDTPVPVQASGKTHTGRLWVYVSSNCTVYEYTESRAQKYPQAFLKNYQGYLQADAYPGYNALYESGTIIEVACWAHARRKFYDITQSVKAPSLADTALLFIGELYAIERRAKLLSHPQRKALRRHEAKFVLKKIHRWCRVYKKRTLPQSPIAKAIAYVLNHWRALQHYCREGFLDIDNNRAERSIKPLAIGRKNWLFAGSHQGGKSAAIIYSIIESCKQNGVNTLDYLKDVLTRLPSLLMKNLPELLPCRWKPPNAS